MSPTLAVAKSKGDEAAPAVEPPTDDIIEARAARVVLCGRRDGEN
jgi:hypothetical protein